MATKPNGRLAGEMADTCLMMRTRVLSRIVTGMYDDELRPFGIQASQLNLLVTVAHCGPIRRSDIGKIMHMDSSTLTRNLRLMQNNGWIEEVAGTDGRGLPLRATAKGDALLAKVAPAWRSAQRRAAALLGGSGQTTLMKLSRAVMPSPA